MIQTEEELFKVYFEEIYKKSNKTRLKAARSGSKNTTAQQPALEKSKSSLDAYA